MGEKEMNNIIKANIELLDENKLLKEDKEILQRRINKVIEYIEENLNGAFDQTFDGSVFEILDLLKGEHINE